MMLGILPKAARRDVSRLGLNDFVQGVQLHALPACLQHVDPDGFQDRFDPVFGRLLRFLHQRLYPGLNRVVIHVVICVWSDASNPERWWARA